jgi:sugar O-acyltransferase (sialic acid O-acetyltransferase NeuD family)
MTRRLCILGTSGLATEVLLVAARINEVENRWDELGLVGPDLATVPVGVPYLGTDAGLLDASSRCEIAVGIGIPALRAQVVSRYLAGPGRFRFPNLVHPRAVVEPKEDRVVLGRGNVICAGAILTCDIRIGDFNHLNLSSTVGHGVTIGSGTVINPGANISGGVKIGDHVLVGTGAQILEDVVVGDHAVVGAGAVVRNPVADGETVVGVPARPLPPR